MENVSYREYTCTPYRGRHSLTSSRHKKLRIPKLPQYYPLVCFTLRINLGVYLYVRYLQLHTINIVDAISSIARRVIFTDILD